MSELKAYTLFTTSSLSGQRVYLKSEADKVIADLEESHKMEVEQLLMEIVRLKEERRWREFSEEKPEHHQRILVCSRDYKTELSRWDEGCKFDVEMQEIYTHWMPLPKEPEDF